MFNRNSSFGPCSSIFRCSVCFIAGYAFTGWWFQRHCVDFHPQILGVDDVATRLKRPSTSPLLCLSTPIWNNVFENGLPTSSVVNIGSGASFTRFPGLGTTRRKGSLSILIPKPYFHCWVVPLLGAKLKEFFKKNSWGSKINSRAIEF